MSATARGWLACAAPILLWMTHLTVTAVIVDPTCTDSGLRWLPHVLTAVLGLACLPFLAIAVSLTRDGRALAAAETRDDLHFLGLLALGLGAASVLLIVSEGLVAAAVNPCI
jgi:hypothetical protein